MVDKKTLEDGIVETMRKAVTALPPDVTAALEAASRNETNAGARREMGLMLENVKEARECVAPMCQDTGIPVFFVKAGRFHIEGFEKALASAVRRATEEIPLRKNAVNPLTRENSGDNTGERMPLVSYAVTDDDFWEITFMPKGAGSENMSAMAMLNPSAGIAGIKKFIIDTIVRAEGKPCPPVIVGVGVGGSADACMTMAKKALIRPAGSHNKDERAATLERELLRDINRTGVGPMGLGGDTTALAVHVEWGACHTASLPVGINIQCYAARRATLRIYADGRMEAV